MKRRDFIKTIGGVSLATPFLLNSLSSQLFASGLKNESENILVVVFLRGGMDGLSLLPPQEDPNYYRLRPLLATNDAALKKKMSFVDGFGLFPTMKNLRKIYNDGEASFICGAGIPENIRSHFNAQDRVELGLLKNPLYSPTETGFIARYVNLLAKKNPSNFSAIAVQKQIPRSLDGAKYTIGFEKLEYLVGNSKKLDPIFLELYKNEKDMRDTGALSLLEKNYAQFLDANKILAETKFTPSSRYLLSESLANISSLIRAGFSSNLYVTEMLNWDTHVDQGNELGGEIYDAFTHLDTALGEFWQSIHAFKKKVCLIAISEFGRKVSENNTKGSEHGIGGTFILLNGNLKNKIFHKYVGLEEKNLIPGYLLKADYDYRAIFQEIFYSHLKQKGDLSSIFTDYPWKPKDSIGLFT